MSCAIDRHSPEPQPGARRRFQCQSVEVMHEHAVGRPGRELRDQNDRQDESSGDATHERDPAPAPPGEGPEKMAFGPAGRSK